MQVAGKALALVLACGLQVLGQLDQLRSSIGNFDLQAVAFQLHHALQLHLLELERLRLAQVQKQRQQAHETEHRNTQSV